MNRKTFTKVIHEKWPDIASILIFFLLLVFVVAIIFSLTTRAEGAEREKWWGPENGLPNCELCAYNNGDPIEVFFDDGTNLTCKRIICCTTHWFGAPGETNTNFLDFYVLEYIESGTNAECTECSMATQRAIMNIDPKSAWVNK